MTGIYTFTSFLVKKTVKSVKEFFNYLSALNITVSRSRIFIQNKICTHAIKEMEFK